MAKLVVLSEGLKGTLHDLTVDRTTVGRVEDNAFQVPDASVSSHHCEILLKGNEVVVKDLDSTNGTFIDGQKITEAALKAGQTLRLGQVELIGYLRQGSGAGCIRRTDTRVANALGGPCTRTEQEGQKHKQVQAGRSCGW